MSFELLHKPTFTNQLLALPKEFVVQVLEKVQRLCDDPMPDGKVKKKLKGYKNDVYRLRSGDLRIIYTIAGNCVALLGVDDRKEVYRGEPLDLEVPSLDQQTLDEIDQALETKEILPTRTGPATSEDLLPIAITEELLTRLRVESQHFPASLACRSVEDLVSANIPAAVLDKIFDAVTNPDFDQVVDQPSFVTGPTDNLLRFKEGDLLGFLLKLDQEQEKYATWAVSASGPTLLKGAPGTGKSTVALYRVKNLMASLRKSGVQQPRILFTTYTNALVNFSKQLLESLLSEDVQYVDVRTADSIALKIFVSNGANPKMATMPDLKRLMASAISRTIKLINGTQLQQQAKIQILMRLTADYLIEEVNSVIEARGINTLDEYLLAGRAGRLVPLNKTQRSAVWEVRQSFLKLLAGQGLVTWQQIRTIALNMARNTDVNDRYDAVVIDEAQDIEPNALSLLVTLCREPKRLFITADANQSIYGNSFRWVDVHDDLRFQGRTGVLKTNHRTTKEIAEASRSYLANGSLDDDEPGQTYVHSGSQPAIRSVGTLRDEAELLVRFFKEAAKELRLGLSACAVLVPTENAGKEIAGSLTHLGLHSEFMTGRTLELNAKHAKVITLKSAKGLEFPIVALAGFLGSQYPMVPQGTQQLAVEEIMTRERRTMFVGMTRSMRALLVVAPKDSLSPLLDGFDSKYWNLGDQAL
jgi:superfamily I DNA/RNA helicase/mRNA-degrading endonuclease RelE of RelBE toxin-antitoxin system